MKWHFFPFSLFFGNSHNREIETEKGTETRAFTETGSQAGEKITVDRSLELSAVWACVNLRSRIIGSMPIHIRNEDRSLAKDNPLYNILHYAPNADMTASEFWAAIVLHLDLHGNAYARISRKNDDSVSSLTLLEPQKVSPIRAKNGVVIYRVYKKISDKKEYKDYNERDILHFRGLSLNGIDGLSPIEYARQYIGTQIASNKAADNSFKTSLKAGGFIESGEQILTKDQRERLRGELSSFSQPENAGKFIVLEAGQKVSAYKPFVNAVDSDMLASRQFGVEEICRIFGVPPVLIGHTGKTNWASSLEQTNQQFLTYSIDPTLVRIEQTLHRKLLPEKDWTKFVIKFNRNALMRADLASRTAYYTAATTHGWVDINEIREKEDMEVRSEKMANSLLVQAQMRPIDDIGANNDGD